jgi:hypothetical protein
MNGSAAAQRDLHVLLTQSSSEEDYLRAIARHVDANINRDPEFRTDYIETVKDALSLPNLLYKPDKKIPKATSSTNN